MATSGSHTVYAQSSGQIQLRMSWNQTGQNVASNSTTISWKVDLLSTVGTIIASQARSLKVYISGVLIYDGSVNVSISKGATKTLASGSRTISHNSDGTMTFSYSATQSFSGISYTGLYSTATASGSDSLTTIPRATEPNLSSSSVKPNTAVTIYQPRKSSAFVHTVSYACGNDKGTIGSNLTTSVNWTVPASFITSSPNANRTCVITCHTYNGTTLIGTKTINLAIVPYSASSISSVVGNYLGSGVTVNLTRQSNLFTHTLWYHFGGKTWQGIANGIATSKTFIPPISLASQIPNASSGTLTIVCRTYYGQTVVGSDVTKAISLTIPNSVQPNFTSVAITGIGLYKGMYLSGISKVQVQITGATGSYGSTIKGYAITGQGINANSSSGTSSVLPAGSFIYTGKVTDSRNRVVTKTSSSIVVQSYVRPSIKATIKRGVYNLTNNTFVINEVEGTTLQIIPEYTYTSLGGQNSITTKTVTCNGKSIGLAKSGEAIYLGKPEKAGAEGSYSTDNAYVATVSVKDEVGNTASIAIDIETGKVTMDLYRDGTGIAFGEVAQVSNSFSVNYPANFKKGLQINGVNILNIVYPVGIVVEFGTNVDPNKLPGFTGTTWQRYAPGRVTVGYQSDNGNFNSIGKTGGISSFNNSHNHAINNHVHGTGNCTLTLAQIPSHGPHLHDGSSSSTWFGYGNTGYYMNSALMSSAGGKRGWFLQSSNEMYPSGRALGGSQAHNHGNTGGSGTLTSNASQSTQTVLQPYITVSKWIRTK